MEPVQVKQEVTMPYGAVRFTKALQANLAAANRRISSLQAEVQRCQAAARKSSREAERTLASAVQKHQKEIDQAKGENHKLELALKKPELALSKLQGAWPNLNQQYGAMRELTRRLTERDEKIRQITAGKESAQTHARQLQIELVDLREQVRTTPKLESMRVEEEQLRTSIAEKTTEIERLKLECAKAKDDRYDQLLSKHEQMEAKADLTAHLDLQNANEQIKDLKADLANHEERLGPDVDYEKYQNKRLGPFESRVPAEFVGTNFTKLKRKATEDLYMSCSSGAKRLRMSKLMNFPGLREESLDGVCAYISSAQNEILRMAAKGGLINPLHFDVTPRGIIGISPLGMQRASLFHKYKSEPNLLQDWRTSNDMKFSENVRRIINENGFIPHGHSSILPLKSLMDCKDVTMESLSDHLTTIQSYTEADVQSLQAWLIFLQANSTIVEAEKKHHIDKQALVDVLRRLTDSQAEGCPTDYVKMIMNDGDLTEVLYTSQGQIEGTVKGYLDLFAQIAIIGETKIPPHYLAPCSRVSSP